MDQKIKVLIVEDTITGQKLLKGLLTEDSRFEIVGIANNGKQAVEFVALYHPDVVSMDIFMPVMDGLEATRLIMQQTPVPIVIVSSFFNPSEMNLSFSILKAGALTILQKPFGPRHPKFLQSARHYQNVLIMMSGVKVKTQQVVLPKKSALSSKNTANNTLKNIIPGRFKIIAIGASSGGPSGIQTILSGLPSNIQIPLVIVQHIDANFVEGFCDWLKLTSNLPIIIAQDGMIMKPGHVYLPPPDSHLGFAKEGIISISKSPPERGIRPAVSFLFRNVAAIYGKNAVCVLLSGMGADGANEMKMLFDMGAYTIAQDEKSSLVHGMPGQAINLGGACKILSPEAIVKEIIKLTTL